MRSKGSLNRSRRPKLFSMNLYNKNKKSLFMISLSTKMRKRELKKELAKSEETHALQVTPTLSLKRLSYDTNLVILQSTKTS